MFNNDRTGKELPLKISQEIFLDIDYLICRFMKSKVAYKIEQNQRGTLFTIKKIKENNLPPQYQFHIRFEGKDKKFNRDDIIDFDFYISEEEFSKLFRLKGGNINKMGTLREEAQAYEPPTTLNVTELASVPIDEVQIHEGEGTDPNTNKPFAYKYFEVDGKKYRVPSTVLEKIQEIIKLRPDIKDVVVTKTGEGKKTRYKVDVIEPKTPTD